MPRRSVCTEDHRNRGHPETGKVGGFETLDIIIGQHRMRELQLMTMPGRFIQKIALASHKTHERHHEIFAVRIDRRIGHLRKKLPEIIIKKLRTVRENGKSRVIPHRSYGFLGIFHHGKKDHFFILKRVAENTLAKRQSFLVDLYGTRDLKQPLKFDPVLFKPAAIRPVPRNAGFDLVVLDHPVGSRIHQKHFPWREHPLFENVRRIQVKNTHLGGHDHQTTFCNDIPRRPETVPV